MLFTISASLLFGVDVVDGYISFNTITENKDLPLTNNTHLPEITGFFMISQDMDFYLRDFLVSVEKYVIIRN